MSSDEEKVGQRSGRGPSEPPGPVLQQLSPVQQAPQLVSHVDHHHLLAGAGQVGDLALDDLGHAGVDGAAETAVRGHAYDQVLGGLVLGGFDIGLLIQSCRSRGRNTMSLRQSPFGPEPG